MADQNTNYSIFVLTKEESKVFKKFRKCNSTILTSSEYKIIAPTGLVKRTLGHKSAWFEEIPSEGICFLLKTGEKYRSYLRSYNIRRNFETCISVFAIVIAVISLAVSILK